MNGDLISREATKHIISQDPRIEVVSKERVLNYLDGMLGVDQVRPKGRWEYEEHLFGEVRVSRLRCSNCRKTEGYRFDFCPNCGTSMVGADMRESEQE